MYFKRVKPVFNWGLAIALVINFSIWVLFIIGAWAIFRWMLGK